MHDAAQVVGVVQDRRRLQRGRVDAHHRRRAVGPVLRDRRPDVLPVEVDAAVVVLDRPGSRERRVRDPRPVPREHDQVREAGPRAAVGAVDRRVVGYGWRGVFARADDVAVRAQPDHAFGLVGVAFKVHFLDQSPGRGAAEVLEGGDYG